MDSAKWNFSKARRVQFSDKVNMKSSLLTILTTILIKFKT